MSTSRALTHIRGLTAPVFTPLAANGKLDLKSILPYAQHLGRHKVPNIYVGGTSAEFPSFSTAERKEINAEWVKQGKQHLSGHVIVHVGHTALGEAQELARHAVDVGADAIASLTPFFLTPPSLETMVAYFKELTQTVPDTPFLYYHYPGLTHCTVNLVDFVKAALDEIPTFNALKFTDEDMQLLEKLQNKFGDRVQFYNAYDTLNYNAMKLGVYEVLCTTINFMPGAHHRMRQAFEEGKLDKAEEEHIFINQVCDIVDKYTFLGDIGALKTVSCAAGVDAGPGRLPLGQASDEMIQAIKKDLEAIDFFNRQY